MITRRKFVEMSAATGAAILSGAKLFGAASPGAAANSVFKIGGDLEVNRMGFGAMRITGDGIWGWPPDRANANDSSSPGIVTRSLTRTSATHALKHLPEQSVQPARAFRVNGACFARGF